MPLKVRIVFGRLDQYEPKENTRLYEVTRLSTVLNTLGRSSPSTIPARIKDWKQHMLRQGRSKHTIPGMIPMYKNKLEKFHSAVGAKDETNVKSCRESDVKVWLNAATQCELSYIYN